MEKFQTNGNIERCYQSSIIDGCYGWVKIISRQIQLEISILLSPMIEVLKIEWKSQFGMCQLT